MGVIDSYVADLGRSLRGPRRAKADMVREAHDSLCDAADAYQEEGLSPHEAQQRAVAEFGEVREIAPGYQAELGLAQVRRTAMLLFTMLVAQTVAWGPARTSIVGRPELHSTSAEVLDQLMALIGTFTMLAAVGLILALRFAPTRPTLGRVAGSVTLVLSITIAALGIGIGLLDGQSAQLLTWSGIPWIVGFGVLPMLWTSLSARSLILAAR